MFRCRRRRCCRRRGRCLSQAALPVPGRRIIWRSEATNCGAPSFIYICSLSPLEPRQSALAPSTINRHALFTIIITEPHARSAQPPQPAAHTPPHRAHPARLIPHSLTHSPAHSLTHSQFGWLVSVAFFFFFFVGWLPFLLLFGWFVLQLDFYLRTVISSPPPPFPRSQFLPPFHLHVADASAKSRVKTAQLAACLVESKRNPSISNRTKSCKRR